MEPDAILDVELDILGQQPLMNIYTQISWVFAQPAEASDETIIKTLNNGLERLYASFPWTAGQVVAEGAVDGRAGTRKIKALSPSPRVVVKNLRHETTMPSIGEIRAAGFPMSVLDEDLICPRKTIPGPNDPIGEVFMVQANFIKGGLILSFVGLHSTMDMTGQGEVIRLFSKACRDEAFTPEELGVGNMARHELVPFLDDDYTPGPEITNQLVKPSTDAPSAPPPCSWAYFSFPAASLDKLKATANDPSSLQPGIAFVSTDDALTAFIWQATSRARLQRLGPDTPTTMLRAVSARRFVGVPETYPGLLQNMTYSASTLEQISDAPLGKAASLLRAELLDVEGLTWRTRALATHMRRVPDKGVISVTADAKPGQDVMLSSWAAVKGYEWDFGLGLGAPEAVRRPRFMPFESLMYLMPRQPDGGMAVAISLRDEDLAWLRRDEEFGKMATYIG